MCARKSAQRSLFIRVEKFTGRQPLFGSCDADSDRKRNCEEEQKEGDECQKKGGDDKVKD